MNDDMFEDPNDPRVWSGFAQPPSPPTARSGEGGTGETIADSAAARVPAGPGGQGMLSSSESESWLAGGRALLSDLLTWARRQLSQHLTTMLGLVLVVGLFAVVCANIDKLQALAAHGLAGVIPASTIESPLEGRNGPRITSRSPADGSTATTSTGTRGVTPGGKPSATPGASAGPGPAPTATPTPARAPTPTSALPRTLEGKLTIRAPYGASCSGNPCSVLIEAWIGGVNYRCGVYAIKLPYAGSTTILCRLPNTTPSSLPAGAFSGLCAGCGGNRTADIVWTNPSPFYLGS